MKVIALFLQYDTEKYPCALHYFKKYLNGINNAEIQIITIDNSLENEHFEQVAENEIKINGDNSLWEFSGWQAGLKYIYDNKIDYDVVIFANDSFLAPAGGNTDLSGLINDEAIENAYKQNAMVGQFVSIGEGISINGIYIYNYARTHCFLLNRKIVEKIRCLPTVDYDFLNKCISEKPDISSFKFENIEKLIIDGSLEKLYFKADAPLSKNFMKFIIEHLTQRWHSKMNVFENWELFRGKILAYLNEMLLTAKVRELIRIE